MGYLPAAMRNYLVRLGWAHGDQEIFSTQEMVAAFDLPQIGRSPARFDFAKLESLNGHYMRQIADADLLAEMERVLPHIAGGAELAAKLTPELREKLVAAMAGLKERAKTLVELIDGARFIVTGRPLALDDSLLPPSPPGTGAGRAFGRHRADHGPEAAEQVVRAFTDAGRQAEACAAPARRHRPHHCPDLRRAGGAGRPEPRPATTRSPRPVEAIN